MGVLALFLHPWDVLWSLGLGGVLLTAGILFSTWWGWVLTLALAGIVLAVCLRGYRGPE